MLVLPQSLTVPRALEFISRATVQQIQALTSLFYGPKYSLLSIQSDRAGWVLDQEAIELQRIASSLGIDVRMNRGISPYAAQCCHYTSQFVLRRPRYFRTLTESPLISIIDYRTQPPSLRCSTKACAAITRQSSAYESRILK